jgi:hypothetical protein
MTTNIEQLQPLTDIECLETDGGHHTIDWQESIGIDILGIQITLGFELKFEVPF